MSVQGSGFGAQEKNTTGAGRALLLTPPGGAAIAVVRLVGPGVGPFLGQHFSGRTAEGRCVHGTLSDAGRVIDDPVVVLHSGGAVADINLHGGPWVVRSVLELARRNGFEAAERPGLPLPDEAVDADTELGREVLRYLPLARTELAVQMLLAQERAWGELLLPLPPGGEGGGEGENLRGELRSYADPTPKLPPHPNPLPQGGEGKIRTILADRSLHWLLHPPRVAIVGVPNVGKSTLANQLFAQERSITADLPGTTRDWVGEIANIDGLAVMLVDTPGLRETPDAIEREAIERGRGEIGRANLIVIVLDPTQPPDGQRDLVRAHPDALRVVNKADCQSVWDTSDNRPAIRTVATTGEGVGALRNAIEKRFFGDAEVDPRQPRWWTDRQRMILERALIDPEVLNEI
jgi:tRNA modification GTPase